MIHIISTILALIVVFGIHFATWYWEAFVVTMIWQWHVGLLPFGLTTWQLTWVNASIALFTRGFMYVTKATEAETGEHPLGYFGQLLRWAFITPGMLLFMAWVLKAIWG